MPKIDSVCGGGAKPPHLIRFPKVNQHTQNNFLILIISKSRLESLAPGMNLF